MKTTLLGIILAVGLQAAPAQAALVTFDYVASGLAAGGFGSSEGATFVGQFGWETATADSDPDDPRGEYLGAGFWRGSITGGPQDGLSFDTGLLDIRTMDNVYFGGFGDGLVIYVTTPLFPDSAFSFVNLLDDNTNDALSSPALPLDIELADWNFETRLYVRGFDFGLIEGVGSNQFVYELTAAELRVSEVPLPASVFGFATAILALGGIDRLRRRREAQAKKQPH